MKLVALVAPFYHRGIGTGPDARQGQGLHRSQAASIRERDRHTVVVVDAEAPLQDCMREEGLRRRQVHVKHRQAGRHQGCARLHDPSIR